jgi:hypothetical protein
VVSINQLSSQLTLPLTFIQQYDAYNTHAQSAGQQGVGQPSETVIFTSLQEKSVLQFPKRFFVREVST